MSRASRLRYVVTIAFFACGIHALDASAIEVKPIRFAKGESMATVKGVLAGDQIIDYTLRTSAGQTMSVKLETDNASNYFNVLPPGSKDAAIFIGSTSGTEWTGALPVNGEYTIRLYLMRSAARRAESARFTLTVGVTGSPGSAARGAAPASDAKVENTPFHATGQVPCSMGSAPTGSQQCDFGVIRGATGNADVHVTPPGGLKRVLVFRGGSVTAEDGARVEAAKSSDQWSIEVNDYERYSIPEAVISGG